MARRDSGKKAAKGGKGVRKHARPAVTKRKAASKDGEKTAVKKAATRESGPKWPTERAVLFKPDRLKYVRKMIKPEGCVFCLAVEKGPGPESLLLYKGKHAIVVMNKFPYNPGHLLVLPLRHCGEFLDLSDEELQSLTKVVQHCVRSLKEVYSPAGFNVGLNLGSAAGAGIPEHLHYHIVPRWSGDTNFFPLIAETKVVVETLEQTFESLLPYFARLT